MTAVTRFVVGETYVAGQREFTVTRREARGSGEAIRISTSRVSGLDKTRSWSVMVVVRDGEEITIPHTGTGILMHATQPAPATKATTP